MDVLRQILKPGSARSIANRGGYCNACAKMLSTSEGIRTMCTLPGYRHLNKEECRKSAERGCTLCDIILRQGWEARRGQPAGSPQVVQARRAKEAQPLYFIARRFNSRWKPPSFVPDLEEAWDGKLSQGYGDMECLDGGVISCLYFTVEDPASTYFPARTICDNFLHDQVMEEAAKFISDCIGGRHENCVYLGKPRLPTRVLDIDPSLGPMLRLQPTTSDSRENYVALSYSWGGPQPLTTIQANISKLMAGIDISALPQTLQDAVHVTRRLGVRYLWIDALCIIQDSEQDKLAEIGRMGAIYRNATVTLAASYSRTASDGFLKACTDHKLSSSCIIPVSLPGSPRLGEVTLAVEKDEWRSIFPEPLRTRGWAFQEAILSQRLLIFSKYDLRCHCRFEHGRSLNLGNLAQYNEPTLYNLGTRHFERLDSNLKMYGDNWMQPWFLSDMWEAMLRDFTLRALTVPDDRPHAMQGIANELLQSRHLSNNMDKTYVAGTWMACLPDHLLWCRFPHPVLSPDEFGSSTRLPPNLTRSNRAPTWSWCSLDCPIWLKLFRSEQPYEGFLVIKTPSPTGGNEPSALALEIECHMLCRSRDEFTSDRSEAKRVRISMDLDVEELPPNVACVYYMMLAQNVKSDQSRVDSLKFLFYVSGIVTYETPEGYFRRLGHFKWNVSKPASEEFAFGQKRSAKLV
ncbi:heterokaryon incompatibility protein-domain-containing protein [Mariannaea sp. PMI_226]|nr:heterokaryon incompatibility protein-domain-containing protein [Mariannaea sp. PMI_226]